MHREKVIREQKCCQSSFKLSAADGWVTSETADCSTPTDRPQSNSCRQKFCVYLGRHASCRLLIGIPFVVTKRSILTQFHRSWSSTQNREYVNTRRTIHPSIHSRRPSVPCGCCTCLEFIAAQCSVYVVAGILLSTSEDSPVRCIISSLTLNAILELNFVQCPCNSFCDSVT